MNTIYHIAGHILIIVNLIGFFATITPQYRGWKMRKISENGYHLWQEQLVTTAEIAVGIMLIQI